ncbi:LEAF RUST 10 DISEASE-RESISTANCE LOCUS RECEPTOR-LIKE PROTEIN KINASE-like 2.4 [Momordica charantia]|uniref:non-specific serine/threonine protein kinase n=1 Tax=Momordica charantia TaxID=3673 RepID=A0A6J1C9E3_MOMCH|nr:LEAF RUST 10 DISEASE-RESISTANCE LOCUS RECEPTOR-LIKE PROTEIN KINASE-like 2.4 [Momordica charantia]
MISDLLFISLMAFNFLPCFSEDALDEFKACSVSYNCGELVNITYPFWGNERPELCGRRELELKCKNKRTTTIEINSVEYNVLEIEQSYNGMRIARSDVSESVCPKNQMKTGSGIPELGYPFENFWNSGNNISLWYNCSVQKGISESYRFWCGGEKEGRVNYGFGPMDANLTLNLEGQVCEMNINVTADSLTGEGGNNRTAVLENSVRQGFFVSYFQEKKWYTIACEVCNDDGGICGGNATYAFYCTCAGGDAHPYRCLPTTPPPPSPPPSRTSSSLSKKKSLIIVAIATGCVILMISIIIFIYHTSQTSNRDNIEEIIKTYSTRTPKRYSYSQLKKITDSFNNQLGQGGFSTVYKGTLPDGRQAAVKLLNESRDQTGQDFMNEVVSITRTSHVNVVTLLGFCYERDKRALIYEYMPKGSLDKYIFNKGLQEKDVAVLHWNTLYSIIMGVARGLDYLHRGCSTRIVHFDIKPHNILLDDEFCPKISDFGLAKQCRATESYVSVTGMKGTAGFMAPEVMFRNVGKVSHKSDVYSYGMLVLQMVGERKSQNEEQFPDWIYKDLAESEKDGGRGLRWGNTEEEEEKARKLIGVGLCCIQSLPEERPSMSDVVAMLEGSVDGLHIPPKSALFGPPAAQTSTTILTDCPFN